MSGCVPLKKRDDCVRAIVFLSRLLSRPVVVLADVKRTSSSKRRFRAQPVPVPPCCVVLSLQIVCGDWTERFLHSLGFSARTRCRGSAYERTR